MDSIDKNLSIYLRGLGQDPKIPSPLKRNIVLKATYLEIVELSVMVHMQPSQDVYISIGLGYLGWNVSGYDVFIFQGCPWDTTKWNLLHRILDNYFEFDNESQQLSSSTTHERWDGCQSGQVTPIRNPRGQHILGPYKAHKTLEKASHSGWTLSEV